MSRKSKYFKFQDGLDLAVEKEFLGTKNIKAYLVLKELSTATGSLDNKTIAQAVGISLRSYAEWKNHLVMCGLLQVRQLNALTYVYVLGEDAIEYDDELHKDDDYERMVGLTYEDISLIDSAEYDDKAQEYGVPLYSRNKAKLEDIYKAQPMPTTEEIIESF